MPGLAVPNKLIRNPVVDTGSAREGDALSCAAIGRCSGRSSQDHCDLRAHIALADCTDGGVEPFCKNVKRHLASPVTGMEEVFNVQVLPGTVSPHISGPWADRDTGRPLWTVPPP